MQNIIKLSKGGLAKVEGGRVLKGEAWVTGTGSVEDFIVSEGQALPCCFKELLVEALSEELIVERAPISQGNSIFGLPRSA